MNSLPDEDEPVLGPLASAEKWLDDRGKGAWIALIVLGFVFFWPVGLALLIYVAWGRSMHRARRPDRQHATAPVQNAAFEAYREETLRRVEDEQGRFEGFLDRQRTAKDQHEFDAFLDRRAEAARAAHEAEAGDRAAAPGAAQPQT